MATLCRTTKPGCGGKNLRYLLPALIGIALSGTTARGESVAYRLAEPQSWARVIEGVPPSTPGETVLEGTRVLSATAILEQTPGGLETNLTGCLQADLSNSTLEFTAGSTLDAMQNPHGPFDPPVGAVGTGSSEDNFGGQDHLTGSLVKVAVRDGVVDIVSGMVTPNGPATDLDFGFISGTLEYDASLLGTGSLDLPATIPPGPNRSSDVMSGSLDGTITIPFLIEESYELLNLGGSRLVMQGQIVATRVPVLLPGDANQDFSFDQLDIVAVLSAAKYRTEGPASWGEGDWNGAPGGCVGIPPTGDGVFDQFDIIAAQQTGSYLTGPYAGNKQTDPHAMVPEPGSLALLAFGLLVLLTRQRRSTKLTSPRGRTGPRTTGRHPEQ